MKIPYLLSLCFILITTSTLARGTQTAGPRLHLPALPTCAARQLCLPVIGPAADGEVLTIKIKPKHLHELMGDKLVLLSFIYATCSDINGCPLATQVLHKISRQLQKQPELANKLRLLTLSFDPTHDTPDIMRQYGEGFKTGNFDWQFLTTRDETALQPILDAYQQNIQKIYDH